MSTGYGIARPEMEGMAGENEEGRGKEELGKGGRRRERGVPRGRMAERKVSGQWPTPTGHRRQAKGTPSKVWLHAVIVVLVIMVPIVGAVYFYYGPAGEIKKIDLIAHQYTNTTVSRAGEGIYGMFIVVHVDAGKPSSLSGSAELRVSLNGSVTYAGTIQIDGSRGIRRLPFSEFAVGRGDYRVEVSFQGKRASTIFPVRSIIEGINATAYVITNQLNATLVPPGKARIGVIVTFMDSAGISQKATPGDALEIKVAREGEAPAVYTPKIEGLAQYVATYPVPGNGNYTVSVAFLNSNIKKETPISRIETLALDVKSLQTTIPVRIPPTANAGPDRTAQWKFSTGGAVVTFDGSGSIAYEGATLVNYYWNFGDDTGEEGVKVTHVYTKAPDPTSQLIYRVQLTVTDSNGEFATDEAYVTVTL